MKQRFLVGAVACDVTHRATQQCRYQVASCINPHMRVGAVDFERARAQHREFCAALVRVGAQVSVLPFVHGCPDSVFVKDAALLVDDGAGARALLARPVHPERAGEQAPRARQLRACRFSVRDAPPAYFEGGDIVVLPDGGAFVGIGTRSHRGAAEATADFLGAGAVGLDLVDDHFFHLDTCLGVLDDGTAFVVEGALSASSEERVRRHPAVRRVLRLSREEGLRFGTNFVQVGDAVLLHAAATGTGRTLSRLGLVPVPVELSEFVLAGGAAACLVARVHEEARKTSRVAA